jgi:putative IMPACT (imprinted ancient) family translation regulator
MQQVSDTCTATYEVKRSTFTSYLVPYPLFERTLQELREAHPKASHIVSAYRYLNSYDQIIEYSTDDGEPKGCAGNPTLAQLRGADLINTALLTVRYFGGIKLGTGGIGQSL